MTGNSGMVPAGHLYKKPLARPDWLAAPTVVDIYSLSGCLAEPFTDYVNFWRHNGFWLFDSPGIIESIAHSADIDMTGMRHFFYEVFGRQYVEESRGWVPFSPEASFATSVEIPVLKTLEGFDVATFWCNTTPECSPLTCNGLAAKLPTNEHALFRSFDEARQALESGAFENSEPGPYRIFAVYSVA